MLTLKGKVECGSTRGSALIETFYYRLIGLVGFEPFKGTLNVQLESKVDVSLYSTRAIDHVLLDGTRKVYAYLAPVIMTIKKDGKSEDYNCWALREPDLHHQDVVEIVAADNIKDKFGVKDGDVIDITFIAEAKKKKVPGAELFRRLYGIQTQMMK